MHVHTSASDGLLAPAAVVARAQHRGLAAIAITDHDTMSGVSEAMAAGPVHGVEVVPGVEVSVDFDGRELHIIGFYPSMDEPGLDSMLQTYRRARKHRYHRIVSKLRSLGIDVECTVQADEPVGRPHIARELIRKGVVSSMQQAFERFLGRGGAAFVDRQRMDYGQVLAWMVKCHAVPVLAHPGLMPGPLVRRLQGQGLIGLEVYHPDHDFDTRQRLLQLATELDLLVTGGSDFHGPGSSGYNELGGIRLPYSHLEELKQRRIRLAY